MAKKTLQELQYEFDGLLKGVKRAEQLKGATSKFAPVFKARGMKGLKDGGPIVKRKSPGMTAPKVKKIPSGDLDWMKGLTEDQIKEMISGPKVGGERRANIKKKKKKKNIQMANVKVKKIPTVPMDPSLSATFRKGGKGGTKSRQPKKFIRKTGGVVKRKSGGSVGTRFVADCYK